MSFKINIQSLLLTFSFLFVFIAKAQLNADFTADTTKACDVLGAVKFTDQSTGNITSWLWDFGNGNKSTLQNPTASFTQARNYTVKLVISDGVFSDSIVKTEYIKISQSPNANFSFTPDRGCPTLTVNFNDLSTAGSSPIVKWLWDYGDGGQPINSRNHNYDYISPGRFQTSLVVVDTAGCRDSKVGNIVTVLSGPVSRFKAKGVTDTCLAPLLVEFENLTKNQSTNTTYKWYFGDGNTSTLKEPTHTYVNRGTYDVSLVSSNGFCSDSITLKNFVRITDAFASFSLPKDTFCLGDTLEFENNSFGVNTFNWDFGDGTSSNKKNPIKIYNDSGWVQVKLSVSSAGVCTDDTTYNVYIEQAVADFTSTDGFACQYGDTVFFTSTSTNAVKWSWRFQNSATSSSIKGKKQNFYIQSSEGIFTDSLIVTSLAGCKDTTFKEANREVDVANISIHPDSALRGCSPFIIDFTHTINSTFPITSILWDFDNGITSTLDSPPTQSFIKDSLYMVTLTVTDSLGCVNAAQKSIAVGVPVEPIIKIRDDSLCHDDELFIFDDSRNPKIQSYQWYLIKGQKEIFLGAQSFVDLDKLPDTGIYTLKLTAAYNGCDTTIIQDSAITILNPKGKPFAFIDSCGTRIYKFWNNSDGIDNYFWDFGDGDTSHQAEPLHEYTQDSVYKVKYVMTNDSTGCSLVDSFKVFAEEADTNFIIQNNTGCVPFALDVQGPVNMYATNFWILGDTNVGAGNNYFDSLKVRGEYNYSLVVKQFNSCADTFDFPIRVFKPESKMIINVLDDCVPHHVQFINVTNFDTTAVSSRWLFDGGLSTNGFLDTVAFSIPDSIYDVMMISEDIMGCSDTLIFEDTIKTPNKIVDFTVTDSTICLGDTITFINNSVGPNQSYVWTFGDGGTSQEDDPNKFYNKTDSFTVTLSMTDASNCEITEVFDNYISVQDKPIVEFTADILDANCFPLSITFLDTSTSPFVSRWNWDFGNGGKSIVQNPFINYNQPGSFDIFLKAATDNGCADSIVKNNYINITGPFAEISISKDTLCKHEEVILEMRNAVDVQKFLWDFGDGNIDSINPVTYRYQRTGNIIPALILTDSSGNCTVSLTDSIFVNDVIAGFETDDTIGCRPHAVNLLNTSRRADIWNWDFGDGNQSSDFSTNYQFDSAGTFTITMTIANNNGCVDTARQIVIVHEVPDLKVFDDTTVCEGDTLVMEASGASTYFWSPADFLDRTDSNVVKALPRNNIEYKLLAVTDPTCADSATINVELQVAPTKYALRDTNLIVGESVQLNVSSGPTYSYRWRPEEDLSCFLCPNPLAQPLESRKYYVDISDPFDCFSKTDSILINVKVEFKVDLPKAFTPNGDGINDKVFIRGWGLKELIDFKVFNRWGELVYESQDLLAGWDGSYKGKIQNADTYVYVLKVKTWNDEVLSKKGSISLIR